MRLANELGVPLRNCDSQIHHSGDFYGQTGEGEPLPGALSVEGLTQIFETLPAGVTELGCHPGYGDGLVTMYRAERELEVRVLCDPRCREKLIALGIELVSFAAISQRTDSGEIHLYATTSQHNAACIGPPYMLVFSPARVSEPKGSQVRGNGNAGWIAGDVAFARGHLRDLAFGPSQL